MLFLYVYKSPLFSLVDRLCRPPKVIRQDGVDVQQQAGLGKFARADLVGFGGAEAEKLGALVQPPQRRPGLGDFSEVLQHAAGLHAPGHLPLVHQVVKTEFLKQIHCKRKFGRGCSCC